MENATEDKGLKRKGIQKRHYQKNWQKHQINLIHLISKHPVVYTPIPMRLRQSKLNKAKWDNAWLEISTKLGQTSKFAFYVPMLLYKVRTARFFIRVFNENTSIIVYYKHLNLN